MTLPASYFEARYAESDDPWGFASRWYERRKYAVTLASLPRERFRRGFEPGCSIGVLTEQLAQRCDELLASDVAAAAVTAARRRTAGCATVTVERRSMPADWPEGEFDLVVLSELGYYLSRADLNALVDRAVGCLSTDGVLLAVHWRHPVPDYPLSGDEVHEVIAARSGLSCLVEHVEDDFRLEIFAAPAMPSVARAAGLQP